jgi:ADP-ribosylglycohydrolase
MAHNAQKVQQSALWAAYGDALGFMSELTDEDGLVHRTGRAVVKRPVLWRRKIGGRFGPTIELPPGAYSDDTQLRLAVARAIRGDGDFDVEAFARIELPVWLSYALGAGRSTRAAASALSQENVSWLTNFYDSEGQKYLASGGNGAAIRIQPHVWAARDLRRRDSYLRDVIRNAVVTHGHPRGILGAVFHALSVSDALVHGQPPSPDHWRNYVEYFHSIPEIIHGDRELSDFWLPLWEKRGEQKITAAFESVAAECTRDIEAANTIRNEDEHAYKTYVTDIDGTSNELRGSGTKTAIIAAVVSWYFRDDIERALLVSANLLHSDTDSIATMAGAILGASSRYEPEGDLQDREYVNVEALRLARISNKMDEPTFQYPDLLTWKAPRTQLDAVSKINGRFLVSGLGFAEALPREYLGKGKTAPIWQWFRMHYGQTILLKRREEIRVIESDKALNAHSSDVDRIDDANQRSLFDVPLNVEDRPKMRATTAVKRQVADIHQLTRQAIESRFDPLIIGRHLLALAREEDGIERCIAYAAIIAKARRARLESSLER